MVRIITLKDVMVIVALGTVMVRIITSQQYVLTLGWVTDVHVHRRRSLSRVTLKPKPSWLKLEIMQNENNVPMADTTSDRAVLRLRSTAPYITHLGSELFEAW